jgi:hypothetical protein
VLGLFFLLLIVGFPDSSDKSNPRGFFSDQPREKTPASRRLGNKPALRDQIANEQSVPVERARKAIESMTGKHAEPTSQRNEVPLKKQSPELKIPPEAASSSLKVKPTLISLVVAAEPTDAAVKRLKELFRVSEFSNIDVGRIVIYPNSSSYRNYQLEGEIANTLDNGIKHLEGIRTIPVWQTKEIPTGYKHRYSPIWIVNQGSSVHVFEGSYRLSELFDSSHRFIGANLPEQFSREEDRSILHKVIPSKVAFSQTDFYSALRSKVKKDEQTQGAPTSRKAPSGPKPQIRFKAQ